MTNYIAYIFLIMLASSFCSCGSKVSKIYFPYNINEEDESYKLPDKLEEISGLAYLKDEKIFCVQDEDGFVFLYDLKKNEIESKVDFGKDNDYEGITLVGDDIYVLKSNGTLYRIKDYDGEKKVDSKKMTTVLDSSCDAEGLTYDEQDNHLLIACKGEAIENPKGKKVVYSFDLKTKELIKEPYLSIEIEKVRKQKRVGVSQQFYEEFLAHIGNDNSSFCPSGIAIHPITDNIYILSSVGRTLLVMSRKGKMIYTVPLMHKKFKQPEGITFDKDGTMYISNEGKGGHADIKKFIYHPKSK